MTNCVLLVGFLKSYFLEVVNIVHSHYRYKLIRTVRYLSKERTHQKIPQFLYVFWKYLKSSMFMKKEKKVVDLVSPPPKFT